MKVEHEFLVKDGTKFRVVGRYKAAENDKILILRLEEQ
jgi:hypothetical protein